MDSTPGTYVLILHASGHARIRIGRWGCLDVTPGYYAYVGSAFGPGGLRSRISRHARRHKKKHWHVDYLREATELACVWYSQAPERLEHVWARAVARLSRAQAVAGFGCSDCDCPSHLYRFAQQPVLRNFRRHVGKGVRCWSPPA